SIVPSFLARLNPAPYSQSVPPIHPPVPIVPSFHRSITPSFSGPPEPCVASPHGVGDLVG
ncbi:hypothetical protein JXA88_11740, partial [Candidatus Fermentibacteria bacterium]|nr:hypothetical protein [Candidatus Fermentibacteria bacterium]